MSNYQNAPIIDQGFNVYISSVKDDLRQRNINDYVLGITSLEWRRTIWNNITVPHPTVTVDKNIFNIISISNGLYLNFEINKVVFLRTIITGYTIDDIDFTVTIDTEDIITLLKQSYMKDIIFSQLFAIPFEYGVTHGTVGNLVYYNWYQVKWLLKSVLVFFGFMDFSDIIVDFENQVSSINDPYGLPINLDNLLMIEDNLSNLGKKSSDDNYGSSVYDFILAILNICGLKYYWQDNRLIIRLYSGLSTSSSITTLSNYKKTGNALQKMTINIDAVKGVSDYDYFTPYRDEAWQVESFKIEENINESGTSVTIELPAGMVFFALLPDGQISPSGRIENFGQNLISDVQEQFENKPLILDITRELCWDTEALSCNINITDFVSEISIGKGEE